MHTAWEFQHQSSDVFQQQVGHAAISIRIRRPAVAHFLKNQMAMWMVGQVGHAAHSFEVQPLAMQIAGKNYFLGQCWRKFQQCACSTWRLKSLLRSLT